MHRLVTARLAGRLATDGCAIVDYGAGGVQTETRLAALKQRLALPTYNGTPAAVQAEDVAREEKMVAELASLREQLDRCTT